MLIEGMAAVSDTYRSRVVINIWLSLPTLIMEHEVCEENTGKKTSLQSWNKEYWQ